MPTYVSLVSYTDQQPRIIKISPTRLDAAKKLLKEMGGEVRECYLTVRSYDLYTVVEAPDECPDGHHQGRSARTIFTRRSRTASGRCSFLAARRSGRLSQILVKE